MEHGLFTVDAATRRVRGILVPWNERSRVSSTKNKPITFKPGSIRVPRDPSVVILNRQHDRYDPIGRLATADPTHEAGLYAEFDIADTEEGDAWLADHGDLVRLSPELRDIIRDDEDNGTATLTGSALVTEGAFASAGLFAIDEPDSDSTEPETDEPEEPATPKEESVTDTQVATVPGSVPTAAAPKKDEPKGLSARGLFALIDKMWAGRASRAELEQIRDAVTGGQTGLFSDEAGLFALSDVKFDGVGGIGSNMVQPQWLGEVEDGTTYSQKYAPLFGQKNLTALAMSGWKWTLKPKGGTWAGNKAAIPTNTPTLALVSENATRWAGGHDVAREHKDFGTPGFFESYNAAMREDFDRWLDATIVLTEALLAATDITADNPAGLSIGAGWSALIDGAAQIVASGLVPTGAVVEQSVWKQMAKMPSSDTLGYLSAALDLDKGQLEGFSIKPAPATEIPAGHILVVSRGAADVYKLPGSPIRAEAENIANGGRDIGFFGYGGLFVKNSAGIVDVAPYVGA